MAFARKQDQTARIADAQARWEADKVETSSVYGLEDTDTTESLLAQRDEIEGGDLSSSYPSSLAQVGSGYGFAMGFEYNEVSYFGGSEEPIVEKRVLSIEEAGKVRELLGIDKVDPDNATDEEMFGTQDELEAEAVSTAHDALADLKALGEFPGTHNKDRYAREVRSNALMAHTSFAATAAASLVDEVYANQLAILLRLVSRTDDVAVTQRLVQYTFWSIEVLTAVFPKD